MEDVLAGPTRSQGPKRPLICLDEVRKALRRDARAPVPARPGQPARIEPESGRGGVVDRCLCCELHGEPLAGRRGVAVSERRTGGDWAHPSRELVDVRSPDAERIVLGMADLKTHTPASLSDACAPAEAKRLADTLESHDTPKHGSGLSLAEAELSGRARQCRNRRLPDVATLAAEVAAWPERRNAAATMVGWRFPTADARLKLKRLCPSLHE